MMLLPNCGAIVTAALGCLGLLFPSAVGRVLGVAPDRPLGISEFRATYGGFFCALESDASRLSPCLSSQLLERLGARPLWLG
jgi:hypothetical protein